VLLVSALTITLYHRPRKPVPPPVANDYFVDLESNVANAKYRVDGNPAPPPPLRLAPGDHTVEAFLPGYKPAKRLFTLSPGVAKPYVVSFSLEPELARLRLSSGLKSGQVSLDGQPPVDLQDGNYVNDAIALSSEHTFVLTQAGKESLAISFRAEPAGMVTLSAPVKVKDVRVVVIFESGLECSGVHQRYFAEGRAQRLHSPGYSARRTGVWRDHSEHRNHA
jgi:hypothetical protein